ncbi:poly(A)-specific ribonuclease [Salvia divinorum]|uniref:Poly(A)-specific ribonuclease n=1 Tax=Salvia divinorum TaxID=28513 RepID=A0ABD1GD69_SALDI
MAVRNFASKLPFLKHLCSNFTPFSPLLSHAHFIFQSSRIVSRSTPLTARKCVIGGQICKFGGVAWFHSGRVLRNAEPEVEQGGQNGAGPVTKRKKLKGKRAVVRWLKLFRYKKKKTFERMTAEEKILYKLMKARRQEERLLEALRKIEPKDTSDTMHDPEILTPEEHFYFLKMGEKSKNYVPVGRRGLYQGVILNMHLHWKKHQTLKVIVKTFSPDEVKDIASELARLSGGIVLDIQGDNTIIMYRGKNYAQPPTEIMSPRETLSRKKALDKSRYRDALRAVKRYIPKLEQELELLQAQAGSEPTTNLDSGNQEFEGSDRLKELLTKSEENGANSSVDLDIVSDSEDLSDIFETESDAETVKDVKPLYMDEFEKFPVQSEGEDDDFEEHLRQISADMKKGKSLDRDVEAEDLDEVDRMVLRAASLLKKKRK